MKKNFVHPILILTLFFLGTHFAYGNINMQNKVDTTGVHHRVLALLEENDSNLDSLQKALNISEQVKNQHLIGVCRSHMAYYYITKNNYDKAIDNLDMASDIFFSLNDSINLASVFNEKAVVGYYKGDYDLSIEFLNKAIQIYTKTKNKKGLQRSFMISGAVYLRKSDYVNALTHMDNSLKYAKELRDSGSVAQVNNNMRIIYKQH